MNPAEFRLEALKIATGLLDQDLTGDAALLEGKRCAESILEWCHEAGRKHVEAFVKETNPSLRSGPKPNDDFGEEEQRIFVSVRQAMPNGARSNEIAATLGILHHRVQAYLQSLQTKGLVVCHGRSRGARWFLKPAANDASDGELVDRYLAKNGPKRFPLD